MTKTTAEKIAVMQAAEFGEPIEMRWKKTPKDWMPTNCPSWDWNSFEYRVAATKPSVDWSHVSDDIVAIVKDNAGRAWCYETMPEFTGVKWVGASFKRAEVLASFKPGTCKAKDSLIVRPKQ